MGDLRPTSWVKRPNSEPPTLTYRFDCTETKLRHALGDKAVADVMAANTPEAEFEVPSDSHGAMQDLQAKIEAGERYVIAGAPRRQRGVQLVPVARVS